MAVETKKGKPVKQKRKRASNPGTQTCQYCGDVLPSNKMFKHKSEKHPVEFREMRRLAGQSRAKAAEEAANKAAEEAANKAAEEAANKAAEEAAEKQAPVVLEKEAKKSETKEEQQVRGRFITKVVDLPGDILVLYWLAKAAFPDYKATEGEWIGDCVRQFYAEHSEELGLDKLLDKTYETVTLGVPAGAEVEENGASVLQAEKAPNPSGEGIKIGGENDH